MRGTNRDTLRRRNLALVLSGVHRSGGLTRSDLTSRTGLNRSTIGTLVAELADRGLVEEVDAPATGAPGRPSPLVCPQDRVLVFAADIATHWIAYAVAALGGTVLRRERLLRDNDARSFDATVSELLALIDSAVADLQPTQSLYGVGIAAPGVVRERDGFVHLAPNVRWRDVPLAARVAQHVGPDVQVLVANEAKLGATAEHLRGAGIGVDDMIYVSSEVGVGGGIIHEGRLLTGADGYSGEVGHLMVNPAADAAECRCGATGCLEAETGALALLRLMGRDDHAHEVAVEEVIASANEGNARAREALEEIGRRLGRGLASLVNVLNPSRIVLGGYFSRALDHLAPGFEGELERRALGPHRESISIVTAALGTDSALLGAAELAFTSLLADPAQLPELHAQGA